MVDISVIAWINGLSALAVVVMCIYIGVSFAVKYKKERKRLQPYVSVLGFIWASSYSAVIWDLLSLMTTGVNVTPVQLAYLAYWNVPLVIVLVMFLGFDLFAPESRNKVMIIYAVTAIPYYILFFGFTQSFFTATVTPGELVNIATTGILALMLLLYVVSALIIVAGGFFQLQRRLTGPEKRNTIYLFLGWTFYPLGALMETTFPVAFTPIARVVMILAFYFLIRGFTGTVPKAPESIISTQNPVQTE